MLSTNITGGPVLINTNTISVSGCSGVDIEYWQKYPVSKELHGTTHYLHKITNQYQSIKSLVGDHPGLLDVINKINKIMEKIYDQEFVKHRLDHYLKGTI
jgi:hypothetical protein